MPSLYSQFSGSGPQYQRKANLLEGLLNVLQMPVQGIAGATDAMLSGRNPIEGAGNYIKLHKDFIGLMQDRGAPSLYSTIAGTAANIAFDPTSYLGFGEVTGAGRAARAADMASVVAERAGSGIKAADSLQLGAKWSDQAAKGQRSLVSFMGTPVMYGEKVFQQTEKVQQMVGNTQAGKTLKYIFGRAKNSIPDSYRILDMQRKGATAKADAVLGEDIGGEAKSYYDTMNGLGIHAKDAESILRDSVELGKSKLNTAQLTDYMTIPERANYLRQIGESKVKWNGLGPAPVNLIADLNSQGKIATARVIRQLENEVTQRFTAANLDNVITNVADRYNWSTQISGALKPIRNAVNYINATNASFLASERATGLLTSDLIGDMGYLHRMFTPEARAAYVEANNEFGSISSAYEISTKFSAQLERNDQLRKLTISEINDMAEAGKLQILGNKKVKLFHDEPFFSTFVRGTDSHDAVESAKMVRTLTDEIGQVLHGTPEKPIHAINDAPEGFSFLHNRLAEDMGLRETVNGRVIKDVALPNDIVELLNSHYERVLAPTKLQPLLNGYDSLMRMWKNITLPVWPAYHARNYLSDFSIITHGADEYGLSIPSAVKSIYDATKGLAGHGNELKGLKLADGRTSMPWDEFQLLLDKFGLKDYSPGRELDDLVTIPRGLKNYRTGIAGLAERMAQSRPIDMAIHAGQFRQNTMNAGYFLGLLREGHSPEIAAMEVKKRLFDFQNLTDVERQVFRRFFPFYSWLRHNIPYQISAMIHQPRILTQIGWTRDMATGGKGPAGDIPLPKFIRQALPIAAGGKPGKPEFLRLRGLLPQADIMSIMNPMQEMQNDLTPVIKTPFEMAMNIDTFQGGNLERYPGESAKRLGIPLSRRWVVPITDQIRPITEANNLVRDQDLSRKLEGLSITKSYKVDVGTQTRFMEFKLQQENARVRRMMEQAGAAGDAGAIINLRKYLIQLNRNPAQLLDK